LKRSLNLILAASSLLASHSFAQDLDLIIRGGSLIDGSGSPATKTDIGIKGVRVVFIGSSAGRNAKRLIDATGLIVTPGFIDPHTHTASDLSDPKRSRNDAYLMQGVTTVATGNDGSSPPAIGSTLAKWGQQGIGTNAALFIGQGTVRREVTGMSDAKPTTEQMNRMKALVDTAMKEGAIGISTGLYYAPGSFSSTEEVIELARIAAQHNGIYDTHILASCASMSTKAGLCLRRKKRKHCVRTGLPHSQTTAANQEWALDFAHDVVAAGRTIRVLSVVDTHTRECLALEVDTGFASRRVTRVLDEVIAQRGRPQAIRCDNGPELTSRHFLAWAVERKIELRHIQPGKPTQNAHVESFHGRTQRRVPARELVQEPL
jgi:N-acyl-D-aspartate/D-glutamate deacylase